MKDCIDNCSGNGTCIFENNDSGDLVEECYQDDSTCSPVCICSTGYFGNACSLSLVEYEYRKKLFENGRNHIGKKLTVIFQEFTKDGIPRFPVAKDIRDYY